MDGQSEVPVAHSRWMEGCKSSMAGTAVGDSLPMASVKPVLALASPSIVKA